MRGEPGCEGICHTSSSTEASSPTRVKTAKRSMRSTSGITRMASTAPAITAASFVPGNCGATRYQTETLQQQASGTPRQADAAIAPGGKPRGKPSTRDVAEASEPRPWTLVPGEPPGVVEIAWGHRWHAILNGLRGRDSKSPPTITIRRRDAVLHVGPSRSMTWQEWHPRSPRRRGERDLARDMLRAREAQHRPLRLLSTAHRIYCGAAPGR
jgi:hypothetical protein